MPAFTTPDTGKATAKDAAIKVAIDNLPHIGPMKSILLGKKVIINLLKLFKMVLNTLIVLRVLRLSRAIYRRDVGHGLISPMTEYRNTRRLIL